MTTTMNDKMNHIKDYVYYNIKNMFNPVYLPGQDISDAIHNGSRNRFGTDGSINGEYFRSMSDNQYFAVMDKSVRPQDITYFRPSNKISKNIDFNKEKLYRLEIVRNKGYFIESNQDISIRNADVTEITTPIDELIIPPFKPLPEDISYAALIWYLSR
jgi:hypothetical protein